MNTTKQTTEFNKSDLPSFTTTDQSPLTLKEVIKEESPLIPQITPKPQRTTILNTIKKNMSFPKIDEVVNQVPETRSDDEVALLKQRLEEEKIKFQKMEEELKRSKEQQKPEPQKKDTEEKKNKKSKEVKIVDEEKEKVEKDKEEEKKTDDHKEEKKVDKIEDNESVNGDEQFDGIELGEERIPTFRGKANVKYTLLEWSPPTRPVSRLNPKNQNLSHDMWEIAKTRSFWFIKSQATRDGGIVNTMLVPPRSVAFFDNSGSSYFKRTVRSASYVKTEGKFPAVGWMVGFDDNVISYLGNNFCSMNNKTYAMVELSELTPIFSAVKALSQKFRNTQ